MLNNIYISAETARRDHHRTEQGQSHAKEYKTSGSI